MNTFDLNVGVSLHSFTGEWVSQVWSFEDLLYNVSQLGGGVEIVGPAHHREFPNVPDEFVVSFTSVVERFGVTPTSYGSYADPFMLWERPLTEDEMVAYTLPQLRGAARLGFPIVRLQYFAAPIAERLLPEAERLGLKMGYELHCPLTLESEQTQGLIEQVRRIGSPHLGLIPDAGIFARSVSEFRRGLGYAAGLNATQVDRVIEFWTEEQSRSAADEYVVGLNLGAAESGAREWAGRLWGTYGHSNPADLAAIFEHVIHVHAKFFAMADGDDPDIRYQELVNTLLDNDYQGWLSSEYEGPPVIDSFEMVAEQHAMIRRYIDAYHRGH